MFLLPTKRNSRRRVHSSSQRCLPCSFNTLRRALTQNAFCPPLILCGFQTQPTRFQSHGSTQTRKVLGPSHSPRHTQILLPRFRIRPPFFCPPRSTSLHPSSPGHRIRKTPQRHTAPSLGPSLRTSRTGLSSASCGSIEDDAS